MINQFQYTELYIIVAVKKIMSRLCSILRSLALSIETERPLYNKNLYLIIKKINAFVITIIIQ